MAFSALVAGDAVGQDLQHDGASLLLQGSGDCATPPPVRTQAVLYLGTVGQGQMWHGVADKHFCKTAGNRFARAFDL